MPVSEESIKALTPFKAGDEWKGNRKGRPKGAKGFKTILNAILESDSSTIDQDGNAISNIAEIARRLVEMAKEGRLDAIKEILDRTEGKPLAIQEKNVTIKNVIEPDYDMLQRMGIPQDDIDKAREEYERNSREVIIDAEYSST